MKKNLTFACIGLIVGIGLARVDILRASPPIPQSSAASSVRKCDLTYIYDKGAPNIGENGAIKYNDAWTAVVESGWSLKAMGNAKDGTVYVFEKCR